MSKNYHLSCLIKRNGSWFELGAFIFITNAIHHAAKDQIDRQRVCTINVWVALMSGIIVWVALSPLVMRPVPVVFSPHTLPSSSISLFTVVFFRGHFDGPLRPFSAHPLLCCLSSVSCWWRVHARIACALFGCHWTLGAWTFHYIVVKLMWGQQKWCSWVYPWAIWRWS